MHGKNLKCIKYVIRLLTSLLKAVLILAIWKQISMYTIRDGNKFHNYLNMHGRLY